MSTQSAVRPRPIDAARAKPLRGHRDEIRNRVAAADQILLLLDFDGTLAPIVDDPASAKMPAAVRETLISLSEADRVRVCIISGRALADVRARVGIPALIYAGNHGLEIEGQGLCYTEPEAGLRRPLIRELCGSLSTRLGRVAGIEVENKGLTAAIHFRRAPAARAEVLDVTWREISRRRDDLVLRMGKMVCEIRPSTNWDKGAAALWLKERLYGAKPVLTICIGDDLTDEDAFGALPDGVNIKVGDIAGTRACYHAEDPKEIQEFLSWLKEWVRQ